MLIAQTACEVAALRAVDALRGHFAQEPWADLLKAAFPSGNSFSMFGDRARAGWKALTGDDLAAAAWWPIYVDHVKRRNKAAHRDEGHDAHGAQASIEAATAFVTHVENVARGILGETW